MLNNLEISIAITFLCMMHIFAAHADVAYYEANVHDEVVGVSATILYAQEIPYVSLGELLHGLEGTLQTSPEQCLANYGTTTAVLKSDNVAVAAPGISFSLIYPVRTHNEDVYLAQADIADFFARIYQLRIEKIELTTTPAKPESVAEASPDEDADSLLEVLPLPSPETNAPAEDAESVAEEVTAPDVELPVEEGAPEEEPISVDAAIPAVDCVVIFDPGHGGQDAGAAAGDTVMEKDISLSLLLKLRSVMKETTPLTIYLTRDADKDLPQSIRAKEAAGVAGDLLISLHTGYSATTRANGVTLFTDHLPSAPTAEVRPEHIRRFSYGEQAAETAYRIAHALAEDNSMGPVTVRTAPLIMQHHCEVPCILIELAYLNNPDVVASITEEEYQTHIVETLARAIMASLSQNSN